MLVNALSFVNLIQPAATPRLATAASQDSADSKPFSRLLDSQADQQRSAERLVSITADARKQASQAERNASADRSSPPAEVSKPADAEPARQVDVADSQSAKPVAEETKAAATPSTATASRPAAAPAPSRELDAKLANSKLRAYAALADSATTAQPSSATAAVDKDAAAAAAAADPAVVATTQATPTATAKAQAAAASQKAAADPAAATAAAGRPAPPRPGDKPDPFAIGGCLPTENETEPEEQPICEAPTLSMLTELPNLAPQLALPATNNAVPVNPVEPIVVDPGQQPVDGAPADGPDRTTRSTAAPGAGGERPPIGVRAERNQPFEPPELALAGLQPGQRAAADSAVAGAGTADSGKSFAAALQALMPAANGGAAGTPTPLAAPVASQLAAPIIGPGAPIDVPVDGRLNASPGTPEFAGALGAQLSTFVAQGIHYARLELNPAEMGPVTVQIQLEGQNAQVRLAAENADTRQALEKAMPELAGSLREAGLTLSGGGVYDQPQQQPSSTGGGVRESRGNAGPAGSTAIDAAGRQQPNAPVLERRRGVVDLIA